MSSDKYLKNEQEFHSIKVSIDESISKLGVSIHSEKVLTLSQKPSASGHYKDHYFNLRNSK